MKFAMNYSSCAAKLLAAGKIELDMFKCPDWPESIAHAKALCPAYVHFPFRAGAGIDQDQLGQAEKLLADTDTPFVNMHLSPRVTDFEDMAIDTCDPADRQMLIEAMHVDIDKVVSRFGNEKVVLENLMWSPWPPYEIAAPALAPDVISQVIRNSGCGLVLDLAHASIAARYLGCDYREYIGKLPVERLRELHVSGTMQRPDGDWDDHYAMSAEDWSVTEWAMGQIAAGRWAQPWMMTFEYGGDEPGWGKPCDPETIIRQAPKLLALVRSL